MDSRTLQQLEDAFTSKVDCLERALELQEAAKVESCKKYFEDLEEEVGNMEMITAALRLVINKGKDDLNNLQKQTEALKNFGSDLDYAIKHIPERLPRQHHRAVISGERNPTSHAGEGKQRSSATPVTAPTASAPTASAPTVPAPRENVYFPELVYLSVEEFEALPKYMKGRLQYSKVNSMMDEINRAFKGKYQILRQKPSKMSDAKRKKYQTYKAQETKDTSGCYFIVADDLLEFGKTKMDKVAQNIMTILRQCGRVREVRGGGLTRYVYVDMY